MSMNRLSTSDGVAHVGSPHRVARRRLGRER